MDGGFNSEKMFIFTSNEETVSEYMVNRPSRIRYKQQQFDKLTDDIIREVLNDKLENKNFTEEFIELNLIFLGFNLDTLLILIDEVNFTGLKPKEAIKLMNIVPEASVFNPSIIYKGKEYKTSIIIRENPAESYIESYWFREAIMEINNEDEHGFPLDNEKGRVKESIVLRNCKDEYTVSYTTNGILLTHPKGYQLLFKKVTKKQLAF